MSITITFTAANARELRIALTDYLTPAPGWNFAEHRFGDYYQPEDDLAERRAKAEAEAAAAKEPEAPAAEEPKAEEPKAEPAKRTRPSRAKVKEVEPEAEAPADEPEAKQPPEEPAKELTLQDVVDKLNEIYRSGTPAVKAQIIQFRDGKKLKFLREMTEDDAPEAFAFLKTVNG